MFTVIFIFTPIRSFIVSLFTVVGPAQVCRAASQVKIVAVEKKINEIVNRLEKTKAERFPDLAAEKESRDREERNEKKAQLQEQKKREKEEQKRKKEMEELRWVCCCRRQVSPSPASAAVTRVPLLMMSDEGVAVFLSAGTILR